MDRRDSLKLGATIIGGMTMTHGLRALERTADAEEAESFWKVVKNRRAVRQFKPDPVPEDHLLRIVDAARMAPCSANAQPWKFIIIQDKKRIQALKNECIKRIETDIKKNANLSGGSLQEELNRRVDQWITGRFSAPAYIVVLVDNQRMYADYNQHDGPLAAGYLMLAARALGYGTVYMTDSIPAEITKKVLNIPDRYTQVCVTPIGVPVQWPTQNKKALSEFIVKESF